MGLTLLTNGARKLKFPENVWKLKCNKVISLSFTVSELQRVQCSYNAFISQSFSS